MALTEQAKLFHGIEDDGQIRLRRTRVFLDGAEVVAERHTSQVLEPGQDVSALPARTRAICGFVWTPAVIAAYAAAKAARQQTP